jgi:hypothetical protein
VTKSPKMLPNPQCDQTSFRKNRPKCR